MPRRGRRDRRSSRRFASSWVSSSNRRATAWTSWSSTAPNGRSPTRIACMQRHAATAAFVVAVVAVLRAQTPAPTFDVAAIKQNKSASDRGNFGGPPSRFTATNVPALRFIMFAYQVQDFLIEGAPDWLNTDRWDINAKAEGNFPAGTIDGPDPRREMLRALLVDRFKLSTHRATRDRPIYSLVVAQPGQPRSPRLHPSTTDCAALGAAFRRGEV